jgi:hypothetical protein
MQRKINLKWSIYAPYPAQLSANQVSLVHQLLRIVNIFFVFFFFLISISYLLRFGLPSFKVISIEYSTKPGWYLWGLIRSQIPYSIFVFSVWFSRNLSSFTSPIPFYSLENFPVVYILLTPVGEVFFSSYYSFETRPDDRPDLIIGSQVRWINPGQPKKNQIKTSINTIPLSYLSLSRQFAFQLSNHK